MTNDPREFLLMSFNAAVKAAQPDLCLPQFLPASPKGNIIVIGAGRRGVIGVGIAVVIGISLAISLPLSRIFERFDCLDQE